MRPFRDPQGDLFESPRPAAAIQADDRAKLVALLQALVREALVGPAAGGETTAREAGDDQDHA